MNSELFIEEFKNGLLHGLANGMDWETTGRIASLAGASAKLRRYSSIALAACLPSPTPTSTRSWSARCTRSVEATLPLNESRLVRATNWEALRPAVT